MADEEEELPVEIAVKYYAVSGPKARRCVYLAMRYDAASGYRPYEGETWIGGNDCTVDLQGRAMVMNGTAAWYTGIWSTLAGSIYATRQDGWIVRNRAIFDPDAFTRWERDRIETHTLMGVFGLDDAAVFAWGHDPRASDDHFPASDVFRWNGADWRRMPGPGFYVVAMHGTAPDDLWVAGPRGVIARWDGGRWTQLPSRHDELVNSIFVAGPDEVYATTNGGTVLEGSQSGVFPIGAIPGANLPADVSCVAKWNGELWVGAGRLGLFKRVGATRVFESVKANVDCVALDARDELVMCCRTFVAGTPDGADFRAYGKDVVLTHRAPYALGERLG